MRYTISLQEQYDTTLVIPLSEFEQPKASKPAKPVDKEKREEEIARFIDGISTDAVTLHIEEPVKARTSVPIDRTARRLRLTDKLNEWLSNPENKMAYVGDRNGDYITHFALYQSLKNIIDRENLPITIFWGGYKTKPQEDKSKDLSNYMMIFRSDVLNEAGNAIDNPLKIINKERMEAPKKWTKVDATVRNTAVARRKTQFELDDKAIALEEIIARTKQLQTYHVSNHGKGECYALANSSSNVQRV